MQPQLLEQAPAETPALSRPRPVVRRAPGEQHSYSALIGQAILILLVTIAPWLFGAIQSAVQVWLYVAVIAALICWLVKTVLQPSHAAALPGAVVPLLLGIGLAAFQLLPLSPDLHTLISPGTAEARRDFLATKRSDLVPQHAQPASETPLTRVVPAQDLSGPISLNPAATRRTLALLVLATAVFVLGSLLFRTSAAQFALCLFIAANGAAFAFFGIVQKLSWNGLLYWRVPLSQGGNPFAAFVNRNHAGSFLLLCLGAAIAMSIWALGRGREREDEVLVTKGWFNPGRWWYSAVRFLGNLDAVKLAAICCSGLIMAGILASLSRGAIVAMVIGGALTLLVAMLAHRVTIRAAWVGAAMLAAIGLVGWVGMTGALQARMATLLELESSSKPRVDHWSDSVRAVPAHLMWGSGLGTYRYVYPRYEQGAASGMWYLHAENQYLESLVETGLVGLALLVTAIALVFCSCWLLVRLGRDTRTSAFGIAVTFALFSQLVHSFVDFALYMPANMLLLALLCGAACGGAAMRWGGDAEERRSERQKGKGKRPKERQRAEGKGHSGINEHDVDAILSQSDFDEMQMVAADSEPVLQDKAVVSGGAEMESASQAAIARSQSRQHRRNQSQRRRSHHSRSSRQSLIYKIWKLLGARISPVVAVRQIIAEHRIRPVNMGEPTFFMRLSQSVQALPIAGGALSIIAVALLLAGTTYGLAVTRQTVAIERALADTQLANNPDKLSSADVHAKINVINRALLHTPDDAEAQVRAAELWIKLYRIAQLEQLDASVPDDLRRQLWTLTSPTIFHARAHKAQNPETLRQLRSDPLVAGALTRAIDHLRLARRACPVQADVHLALAELWPVVGRPADDRVHLIRAQQLAPADAELLFEAGVLELQGDRPELASATWGQALSRSTRQLPQIVAAANQYLDVQEHVDTLFPDSPQLLLDVATRYYPAEQAPEIHRALVDRAEKLLSLGGLPELDDAERHYLLGRTLVLQQQYDDAIASYERAIELSPSQVAWRYELAVLLRDQGQLDEAHEHAKRAARMDPHHAQLRELLREIHQANLRAES